MTASVPAAVPDRAPRVPCPRCHRRVPATGTSWGRCPKCLARYRVIEFTPLLDAAELAAGAGRCANHPGKDASNGCARCGAFVCDVCVTRTGEDLYCPDCFSLLHTRGQLATTQTSRTRWDSLVLLLTCMAPFTCWGSLLFSVPLSVWMLFRLRKDRWLRPGLVAIAAALNLAAILLVALIMWGAMS